MIPAQMNFYLWSNSDYVEHIDVTIAGVPVDMTESGIKMDIRKVANGPVVFNPIIKGDSTGFEIKILYNTIAKAFLESGNFIYDIIVYTDDRPFIYSQGVVFINQGITQNG